MLDTHARKYIDPQLDRLADRFIKAGRTPNEITTSALVIGVGAGITAAAGYPAAAVGLLWLSGLLDAVDGAMARRLHQSSPWGALLDITFDRIVELSVILGLGILHPGARLELMLLLGAIVLSMTVFLTVGALSQNTGKKSFYYQAGLAERTEGFIMSSLMILLPALLSGLTLLYAAAIVFTAGQRLYQARQLLK